MYERPALLADFTPKVRRDPDPAQLRLPLTAEDAKRNAEIAKGRRAKKAGKPQRGTVALDDPDRPRNRSA